MAVGHHPNNCQHNKENGFISYPAPQARAQFQDLAKGQQEQGQSNLMEEDAPKGGCHGKKGSSSGVHQVTLFDYPGLQFVSCPRMNCSCLNCG